MNDNSTRQEYEGITIIRTERRKKGYSFSFDSLTGKMFVLDYTHFYAKLKASSGVDSISRTLKLFDLLMDYKKDMMISLWDFPYQVSRRQDSWDILFCFNCFK